MAVSVAKACYTACFKFGLLGYDLIREIFETGFSRVPVYGRDKNDYVGLLYTKDLVASQQPRLTCLSFSSARRLQESCLFSDASLYLTAM